MDFSSTDEQILYCNSQSIMTREYDVVKIKTQFSSTIETNFYRLYVSGAELTAPVWNDFYRIEVYVETR